MSTEYTRSGIRRAGDDYQDLIALEIMIDWLGHPDRFEWIRVEADEHGFLDDVVALQIDGKLVLRQVKFSGHPDVPGDEWTWDHLLTADEGKRGTKDPLLKKWCQSVSDELSKGEIIDAVVVSNRKASVEIKQLLQPDGLLDFTHITDADTRNRIVSVLGGESPAQECFAHLHFDLDRPGIDRLEEVQKKRFLALGGSEAGWLHLKDELRSWVRNKNRPSPGGLINLADVMSAALWSIPEPLPQDFPVPDDYTSPSTEFHAEVLRQLSDPDRNCVVICASPGVGKSTFVSVVYHELLDTDKPVIRHHYFLSLDDRLEFQRLQHGRVIESLMSDMQARYGKALSDALGRNPRPSEFPVWLQRAGEYFSAKGERLVVIIDGLDHVWRDMASADELDRLFEILLPAPPGVVVLVGTQPVADEQLPGRLLRFAPRSQWLALPSFEEPAVRRWLEHQPPFIELPTDAPGRDRYLDRLAKALYEKTGGHPLHLRYTFQTLREQRLAFTEAQIALLPGCPHKDINDYYDALFRKLPSGARDVLYLFAVSDFTWPGDGVLQCLDPEYRQTGKIQGDLRTIRHLLRETEIGLDPFHSSLVVYLRSLPEYGTVAMAMKKLVLNWLQTKAPEHLQLIHTWLFESDLGHHDGLINGPNRRWIVTAVVKRLPRRDVERVLRAAMELVLQAGNIPRHAELSLLLDYYGDVQEYYHDQRDELLPVQLRLTDDLYLGQRLQTSRRQLGIAQLSDLAHFYAELGQASMVKACYDELKSRSGSMRLRRKGDDFGDWASSTSHLLRVAGITDSITPSKLRDLVIRLRRVDRSYDALFTYASSLRTWHKTEYLLDLAKIDFSPVERGGVLANLVLCALEQHLSLETTLKLDEFSGDPFVAIYLFLKEKPEYADGTIAFPGTDIFTTDRHNDQHLPLDLEQTLYAAFFAFLANYLRDEPSINEQWLSTIHGKGWMLALLAVLNQVAGVVGHALRSRQHPSAIEVYRLAEPLNRIERDSESYLDGFPSAVISILRTILFDAFTLTSYYAGRKVITVDEVDGIMRSQYGSWQAWVQDYVDRRSTWLSEGAVTRILDTRIKVLETTLDEFPNRLSQYVVLARLAIHHNRQALAGNLLTQAAENLFAYGNHKDLFLHGLVETIKVCHKAGMADAKQWLLRLAPALVNVREFTDGDETSHLPNAFTDMLSIVSPAALKRHYLWLHAAGHLSRAEHAFTALVKVVDLTQPVNRAVVSTAVDEDGLAALRARADSGDPDAAQVAASLAHITNSPVPTGESTHHSSSISPTSAEASSGSLPPPSAYKIDELRQYLKDTQEAYSDRPLRAWISYWAAQGEQTQLLNALETEDQRGTSLHDRYDLIFSLVQEAYGIDRAYPWLVKAHNDTGGWYAYWSSAEDSQRRQKIVQSNYPYRQIRFLQDTLGKQFGAYRSPVRLVNYLIATNHVDLVQELVGRIVAFALELITPQPLPEYPWLTDDTETQALDLDVLFSRLSWPTVMTRERACLAIAELIIDPVLQVVVVDRLINWISVQTLESNCAVGLLPLIYVHICHSRVALPDETTVSSCLPAPSALSAIFLKELYGTAFTPSGWIRRHSGDAPISFEQSPFFDKHGKSFIMPLYWHLAEMIDEDTTLPFSRQWAFEWHSLLDSLGMVPDARTLDFRSYRRLSDDHHSLCDFTLSEVYRSAFLRALNWVYAKGRLSDVMLFFYGLQACPVIPELWRVQLNKPAWWPYVRDTHKDLDLASTEILNAVEDLWNSQAKSSDGWLIGQASGRVCELDTVYDLEIYGLFQSCNGPNQPDLMEVVNECRYGEEVYLAQPQIEITGQYQYLKRRDTYKRTADWDYLSVACRAKVVFHPWWQFWRVERDIWLPTPYLSQTQGEFHCDIQSSQLVITDTREVFGKWTDWTFQLNELRRANLQSSTGQCLTIKADRIRDFEAGEGVAFCWLVCLTGYHRNNTTDDYKSFEYPRIFGARTLVVPHLRVSGLYPFQRFRPTA